MNTRTLTPSLPFITSADVGSPSEDLKAKWCSWDTTLLPNSQSWWFTAASGGVGQPEWRPSGGVYLCPGEPSGVFAARMRELKSWLLQRPEVMRHASLQRLDVNILLMLFICPAIMRSTTPLQTRIVLFGHWAVLRALTGNNFENCESCECSVEDLVADVHVEDDVTSSTVTGA
jgi:hypothetical protein